MKRNFITGCSLLSAIFASTQQTEAVKDSFYLLTPVEVRSVRAAENAPFTKTNITKKELAKMNLGQDIPFLLNQTPSVVINSDAGNGVGYTGIRIRGTDATRINVTLNGIPYNDAESQGLFFVNLPDFTSSAGSVQVQRGVGTSSNGAGAFGASINFSTNEVNSSPYLELNNSAGSFKTWKNTIKVGSGLQNGFSTDFRLSRIVSDGFIDRASSNLRSFYFSTAYTSPKSGLRLNVFSGKEKTYQAWYGISEADLKAGKRTVNYAGTERPGDPYDNETDNYTQTHYQLFYNRLLGKKISFNTAVFFTRGKGYYEQYKADEAYADYGFPDPLPAGGNNISRSDMVRQLWLDNDFYGNIFSLLYKTEKTQVTFGGGYTRYNGNHFGKVIWAKEGLTSVDKWYDLDAQKTDFNIYGKQQTKFAGNWYWFYDLQLRAVKYNIDGFRNNPNLYIGNDYHFFNPKAGISYQKNNWKGYASLGIANKEPNRDDFEAGAAQQPKPEQLKDIELGIERSGKNYNWSAVLYYMHYKDQLVLTGKINDVGAYTRSNIPVSYRAGIELQGSYKFSEKLNAAINLAMSRNKVKNFTEYLDDYDNGGQKQVNYLSPDIAFSPNVVGGGSLNFLPVKKMELSLLSKYVGRQFLDNTQNNNRALNSFYVQDIRAMYSFTLKGVKEVSLIAQVNNLFNRKYEPNGYTFSYLYGGQTVTENFYFPMAGTNFIVALNIKM